MKKNHQQKDRTQMKSRSTFGDRVRVYDSHHNFIGIYQLQENQVLKPYKLFL